MPLNFLQKIDQVAHKQMRLTHRAAWLICIAVGMGLVTMLVGIDYLGRFTDPGLRWLASSTLIGLVGLAIWRLRDKLFSQPPSRLAIAQRVEAEVPEIGNRLASAIEFHEQPIEDPSAGSTELRRAVIIETEEKCRNFDFDSVIHREPLQRSYRYALVPMLILVGMLLAIPQGLATGLMRLAMPWSDLAWPRQNQLTLVDPPVQLTSGDTFELIAVDENNRLPNDLKAEYRYATDRGTKIDKSPMQLVGKQGIALRESVSEAFEYRVVGGDDHTMTWQKLKIVEPPKVTEAKIVIRPPGYSGLTESASAGSVKALVGSELEISAKADHLLESAKIELPADETINVESLTTSTDGTTILKQSWIAEAKATEVSSFAASNRGTWSLALQSEAGSLGRTLPKPYEVIPDTVPKVLWAEPQGDLFVTPQAEVLIKVSVDDNLATSKAWVTADAVSLENSTNMPTDAATAESSNEAADLAASVDTAKAKLEFLLYQGSDTPPSKSSIDEGEQLELEATWDLRQLDLAAGTRLDLLVMADDYRPGRGNTKLPRRVFLISDEEFEARVAKKQSLLLSEIQQSLDRQRLAQEIAGSVLAEIESGKPNDQTTFDRLAAGEFEQRQATQRVENPRNGAAQLAKSLADEVARNRINRPELEAQLRDAAKQLELTSTELMTEAKRSLAMARRAAKREDASETSQSLAKATEQQSSAIESLEQVAQSLTGWSDFQQLSEELAQLEKKQADLAQRTAKLAAESATRNPLRATEIRSERQKLLGEQAEASRRFNKLQETMRRLLNQTEQNERTDSQNAVADAEQEASDRDIAGGLREASRQLARNQLGRAAEQQKASVEDLKEMLSTLRRKAERDPEELIKQLEQAREQLAQLEKKVNESQRPPAAQTSKTEQIAQETSRVARKLDRLTADAASRSAQQASESLAASNPSPSKNGDQQNQAGQSEEGQQGEQNQQGKQGQQGQQGQQQSQPSQMADAEEALKKAQKQIEQRIAEIQGEQAERLLDLLEKELPRFIASQKTVLNGTKSLNGSASPDRGIVTQNLGDQQRLLQQEVSKFAVGLAPKPVFEHALEGAIEVMDQAAFLLEQEELGRQTQRSEYIALQRLRHIEQVLKNHREQQEQQQQQGGEGGGQQGDPPKPLPFEVAELKMLRLMQMELIDLTDRYESDRALAESRRRDATNQDTQSFRNRNETDWNREANELSDQQKTLSELAFEMANRDNEEEK